MEDLPIRLKTLIRLVMSGMFDAIGAAAYDWNGGKAVTRAVRKRFTSCTAQSLDSGSALRLCSRQIIPDSG